jgi:hypothetical protein
MAGFAIAKMRLVADAIPPGDKMTPTQTKQTNAKPKN